MTPGSKEMRYRALADGRGSTNLSSHTSFSGTSSCTPAQRTVALNGGRHSVSDDGLPR
jgi:hypothetical protein